MSDRTIYRYNKILVLSDNAFLINAFHKMASGLEGAAVKYFCSPGNTYLLNDKTLPMQLSSVDMKKNWNWVATNFNMVLSLHCKQLFPAELVKSVKCINVHPGYNPYNRGWFPQVFSIINGMPAGASIHEIDEELDHGPIIARKQLNIERWETSSDIYKRIQDTEVELLKENLEKILEGNYATIKPEGEGNVNLKKDFNALCELNLAEHLTMGEAIDKLRALTHGNYKNAWFENPETGEKIHVSIKLERNLPLK